MPAEPPAACAPLTSTLLHLRALLKSSTVSFRRLVCFMNWELFWEGRNRVGEQGAGWAGSWVGGARVQRGSLAGRQKGYQTSDQKAWTAARRLCRSWPLSGPRSLTCRT